MTLKALITLFIGLANVTFCTLDACDVADDLANKFDLVMLFDVFHDVSYPDQLIQGVLKLLKTGGQFLMLDINMLGNLKENRAHGRLYNVTIYNYKLMPSIISDKLMWYQSWCHDLLKAPPKGIALAAQADVIIVTSRGKEESQFNHCYYIYLVFIFCR